MSGTLPGMTVEVDPQARTARIRAGTSWAAVVSACAPHRLTALHGCCGEEDAVRFLLDGGLSVYGRRHGLAANRVRAVELACGARVDAGGDPDGFWALRGGGEVLGPVRAVEVELFAPGTVLAGRATWTGPRAPAVLAAWLAWTRRAPDTVTTTATLRHGRDLTVSGAALVAGHGEQLLGALRGAAPPTVDSWAPREPGAVLRAVDDGRPHGAATHTLLGELDEQALAVLTGPATRTAVVVLHQLGGALAVAPPHAGIRGRLEGRFALAARGDAGTLAALHAALAPWDTGRALRGLAAAGCTPRRCFGAPAAARLNAIRARGTPIPD